MSVTFQLPTELERSLRDQLKDLDQAAKEGFLVNLFRTRKISHYEFSQALGVDRFEAEAILKRHNVTEDLPSAEDLKADGEAMKRVLGPTRDQ
jgi:hypothetical protein